VVAYLRDLPRPWGEASPEARQLIAASLFEETSALGWRVFSYRWTTHAIRRGLGDVIPGELHLTDDEMVLVGERRRTSTTDLTVPARLPLEIALTGVERWTDGAIA
jgi:hypothetical protein